MRAIDINLKGTVMAMKRLARLICALLTVMLTLLFSACGDGNVPYVGENGNWWVGGSDTGVSAQGPKGDKGDAGEKGETGEKGDKGDVGTSGLTVSSVDKITDGNTDTYTIHFSDGSEVSFTVDNGVDGKDGEKGEPGADGASVSVEKIEQVEASGEIITYLITFSNGDAHKFTVTNGEDGKTPYIGDNGNWWIGDADTGIFADYGRDDRIISDGLRFDAISAGGRVGMTVTGYVGENIDVVIPNYVGSTPVISISEGAFTGNRDIRTVSLSKNTVHLEQNVFFGCSSLESVDFNGASIEVIPRYAFGETAIESFTIPDSVRKLSPYCFFGAKELHTVVFGSGELSEIPDYAFSNTGIRTITLPVSVKAIGKGAFLDTYLEKINYEGIESFGEYSLADYLGGYVYLSDNVKFVGAGAFLSSFVYIKAQSVPDEWSLDIVDSADYNGIISTGCQNNGEYIYASDGEKISVKRYVGDEKKVTVPATIDSLPVTEIGYGFGSVTQHLIDDLKELITEESSLISALRIHDEVSIPTGVTRIEYASFISGGTMIFIPDTVENMWCLASESLASSYYAFTSDTLPTFRYGFLDSSASYFEWQTSNDTLVRFNVGIDPAAVHYDEASKSYYYKYGDCYSLLAVMDLTATELTLSAEYNGAPVTAIQKDAVSGLSLLRSVRLGDGITTVKSRAFENLSLSSVIIPDSVTVISASGFNGVCEEFFIEAETKPIGWDLRWAGSKSSACKLSFGFDYDGTGAS